MSPETSGEAALSLYNECIAKEKPSWESENFANWRPCVLSREVGTLSCKPFGARVGMTWRQAIGMCYTGCMDIVRKNFRYVSMPLAELVGRCAKPDAYTPVLAPGER